MINSLNSLTPAFSYNNSKRPQPSEQVQAIQNSLHTGQKNLEDLTKEELASLDAFESADRAAWFSEIAEEMSKTETIARKIAKGESLTPEEEAYINEKNPQLKREAEQAKEYGKNLAKQLKSAKSKEQQNSILSSAIGSVTALQGTLAPIQIQIKMDAILKAKKDAGVKDEEGLMLTGLEPGSLFDEKR